MKWKFTVLRNDGVGNSSGCGDGNIVGSIRHRNFNKGYAAMSEIKKIAKEHPIPESHKLDRQVSRLDRMANFYTEKAEVAPEKQSMMFGGFVNALVYSITIVRKYANLTKKLAKLAEEEK